MSLERKRPARPVGTWAEVWGSLTPTEEEADRNAAKTAKKAPAKKSTKKASK